MNQSENTAEVGREKYWGELTVQEQIERMRTQVKSLQAENNSLRTKLWQMESHDHIDGRIVIPISQIPDSHTRTVGHTLGGNKDDVWF